MCCSAEAVFGLFSAIYYWFPKMFGRPLNRWVGYFHFATTFVFTNGVFFPMHVLGVQGYPRRYAQVDKFTYLDKFRDPVLFGLDLNEIMTYSAMALGVVQIPFFIAFLWGVLAPRLKGMENPWGATTLEWSTASPPPHFNWDGMPPRVHRGPYDYSVEGSPRDHEPQWEPPPGRAAHGAA